MTPILGIMASSISGSKISTTAYESIASSSPSGVSTVTFSSIPGTYTSLQLRFNGLVSTAGGGFYLRFNSDTGSNYAAHGLRGNGSAASSFGQTALGYIYAYGSGSGTVATYPNVGIVDIHNYAITTQNKTVRVLSGADANGSGTLELDSGLWLNTNAITSITIFSDYNWNSGSVISLYGIKGA